MFFYIFLKITTNCLLFLWYFILKHTSTAYNKHSQTSENASYEIFSALRLKKFSPSPEFVILPLMYKCFRHIFCDTPLFYWNFRTRQMANARNFQKHPELFRDKKFRAKIVIPPLSNKVFRYQKISETPKDPPMNVFSTVSQKKFLWKLRYPLYASFFDNAIFPKHPLSIFLSDEKFLTSFFLWYPQWFTQIFAPDRWPAPTLGCSQLVTVGSIVFQFFYLIGHYLCSDSDVWNANRIIFKKYSPKAMPKPAGNNLNWRGPPVSKCAGRGSLMFWKLLFCPEKLTFLKKLSQCHKTRWGGFYSGLTIPKIFVRDPLFYRKILVFRKIRRIKRWVWHFFAERNRWIVPKNIGPIVLLSSTLWRLVRTILTS